MQGEAALTKLTDNLSEGAFMDAVLAQLRTGARPPLVRFTQEDLEALAEEWIGEHVSRFPFLY